MEKWEFDDGASYKGETEGEFMHGYGEYYFPKGGAIYIGQFRYDFFQGNGILINTDGSRYVGEFQDDKYHGFGKLIDSNGDTFYGEFRLGVKEGSGVLVMSNGKKVMGFYKNGLKEGLFTVINPDGKITWALYSEDRRRKDFSLEIQNNETIVLRKSTNHSTSLGEVGLQTKGIIKNQKGLYVGEILNIADVPNGEGIMDTMAQDGYLVHGRFLLGLLRDETYRTHILEGRKGHSLNGSFFADFESDSDEIFYLDEYHPYREGENPDFNEFSEQILKLKRNSIISVRYFSIKLKDYFNPDFEFVIVIVPSHNPQKTESGIKRLAQVLSVQHDNITDGTDCLVRTDFIEKLSHGGDRDISVHLESMEVKNIKKIRNKYVLLFDDVTTTNNSLLAGQELLKEAGAKAVQPFALGQTV